MEKATTIVLISAGMGARFSQLLLTFTAGGRATFPANHTEAFAYLLSGSAQVEVGGNSHRLNAGSYVFSPAGQEWKLKEPAEGTQVNLVLQRSMYRLPEFSLQRLLLGTKARWLLNRTSVMPMHGSRLLLPDNPSFDIAANIFSYKPGAHLPFVETHIMEHGLLMLEGRGIYRSGGCLVSGCSRGLHLDGSLLSSMVRRNG